MRLARDIPLERGDAASTAKALEASSERLDSKVSVMIFPEGTRSKSGDLGEFRDGASQWPSSTGCRSCRSPSRHPRCTPQARLASASRAEVRMLDPIPTEGLTKADIPDLRTQVRDIIIAARDDDLRQRVRRLASGCRRRHSRHRSVSSRPAKPVPTALLVAIASSTAVFAATRSTAVSDEYDVRDQLRRLDETAQLAGFVLASWVGRDEYSGRFVPYS